MPNLDPHKISEREWQEIAAFEPVRQMWGLEDDADPMEFASTIYGAKFNFISGSPGYVGDLYIVQGDALTEVPPIVLRRDKTGGLIAC